MSGPRTIDVNIINIPKVWSLGPHLFLTNSTFTNISKFVHLQKTMTAPRFVVSSAATDHPGDTLVPGDTLTVRWDVVGQTLWDSCYAAIRSHYDHDAIFTDVGSDHPQCSKRVFTFVLPEQPLNSTLKYDGSLFMVRVNTETAQSTFTDSETFR